MDWIFEHFNFVVIIGFVVVALLRRIAEAKKSAENMPKESRDVAGGEGDFGPEEAWRRLQKQLSRSVPPPMKQAVQPPPLQAKPAEMDQTLKRQQDMQERLRQIKESKAAAKEGKGLAGADRAVTAGKGGSKSTQPLKSGLRAGLKDRKQARRAMVMREILGPPLGLR